MWQKIDKLAHMASFYLQRSKIIEGNIANADTPNYKPKDLVFEESVDTEVFKLKTTHPKHMHIEKKSTKEFQEIELGDIRGYDNNRVDIQEELAKLAESSIMYKALGENLKKEFSKLKLVIGGR